MKRVLHMVHGGGQPDIDGCAAPLGGVDPDIAVRRDHYLLHQGKADAGARQLAEIVKAFENTENALAVFRSDADPVIDHPDDNTIRLQLGFHPDLQLVIRAAVFNGVIQQNGK